MLQIKLMSTSREIGLRWMPQNIFDNKSALVQVMASGNGQLHSAWCLDPWTCRVINSEGNDNGLKSVS